MDTQKQRTYGLLVSTSIEHGDEYVTVQVMAKNPDEDYPVNPNSNGESFYGASVPKKVQGLTFAGLGMRMWRSDSGSVLGAEFEYRNVYSVDRQDAARMLRTLTKINKAVQKVRAYEPGDVIMVVAKTLGLTFTATQRDKTQHYSMYRDVDWHFGPITDAREQVRAAVAKLEPRKKAC